MDFDNCTCDRCNKKFTFPEGGCSFNVAYIDGSIFEFTLDKKPFVYNFALIKNPSGQNYDQVDVCNKCLRDLVNKKEALPKTPDFCTSCKKLYNNTSTFEGIKITSSRKVKLGYGSIYDLEEINLDKNFVIGWHCYKCIDKMIDNGTIKT